MRAVAANPIAKELAAFARANVGTYLALLHQALVRGAMPVLDENGQPLPGQFQELSPANRIELAKFLVNKVLPDAEHVHVAVTQEASAESISEADIAELTQEQLLQLATRGLVALPVTGSSSQGALPAPEGTGPAPGSSPAE